MNIDKTLLSLAITTAIWISGNANAQSDENSAKSEQNQAQATTLKQVTVTAQKRRERVQDVPASISALDAEQIGKLGVQRVTDIGVYFSNVAIKGGQDPLDTGIYIRGIGSSSHIIGQDNRVGMYIDGVYIGQSASINQDMIGIDRIEVLRGPQGTLFGKNTVAGAINLITARPSDEFQGDFGVRTGNYGLHQETMNLSGPITDKLKASLAVSSTKRDGYIDDITTGKTLGDRDSQSFRTQIQYDPNDEFSLYITADGTESKERPNLGYPISNAYGTDLNQETSKVDQTGMNRVNKDPQHALGTSVEASYILPNQMTLRSISSFRDTRYRTVRDIDGVSDDLLYVDYGYKYKQYTEELQLLSPSDNEKFKYALGAYFYGLNSSSDRSLIIGDDGEPVLGLAAGSTSYTYGKVDSRSYSLYGNMDYAFTDAWSLGAGFRLTHERKTGYYLSDSSETPGWIASGNYNGKETVHDFSPTVSLTYKANEGTSLYARYSEGYNSGGFNTDFVGDANLSNGISFKPEYVKNYELGLKSSFWGNRASLSAAIFRADYDDYQLAKYVTVNGLTYSTLTNAGKARSQGVEFEGMLRPIAGLTLHANVGYTDGKFMDYPVAAMYGVSYTGNRLPYSSKISGSAGFDYVQQAWQNYLVTYTMEYSYKGDYFDNPANQSSINIGNYVVGYGRVASYGLLDASIRLTSLSSNWDLTLWGRNLTNKTYFDHYTTDTLGTIYKYLGEPRTYGVELKIHF